MLKAFKNGDFEAEPLLQRFLDLGIYRSNEQRLSELRNYQVLDLIGLRKKLHHFAGTTGFRRGRTCLLIHIAFPGV